VRQKTRPILLRKIPAGETVIGLDVIGSDPCNALTLLLVHSISRSQLFMLSAHTGVECAWTQFLVLGGGAAARETAAAGLTSGALISDACWAAHGLLLCLTTREGNVFFFVHVCILSFFYLPSLLSLSLFLGAALP
tara:strand:- start:80 stop:487 length:408 start_codon:yes stop_codon:yes gene_type:complete